MPSRRHHFFTLSSGGKSARQSAIEFALLSLGGLAPDWVRARVLAVFMLVFQGAIGTGSAIWGTVAEHFGLQLALGTAGVGVVLTAVLGLFAWMPDTIIDPSPWNHWRMPVPIGDAPELGDGPVLVTAEYSVAPENTDAFLKAILEYRRIRQRDGAYQWGVFRDVEQEDRYTEAFLVDSWAEHLRQHERSTEADRSFEGRVLELTRAAPTVRHSVAPQVTSRTTSHPTKPSTKDMPS